MDQAAKSKQKENNTLSYHYVSDKVSILPQRLQKLNANGTLYLDMLANKAYCGGQTQLSNQLMRVEIVCKAQKL